MNPSYNNRNQSDYPARGPQSRPTNGRPTGRFSAGRRPPPKRRFKPFVPNWPTRAKIRDERSKRIEYHALNILRDNMPALTFEHIMREAKLLADVEIAKALQTVSRGRTS